MRKLLTTLILGSLALSASSWAGINISKNRYIEGRFIEAFVYADGSGGTVSVRPEECMDCTPEVYAFDASVRVVYKDEERSISDLKNWDGFPGEIAVSKSTQNLVKIRRTK